MSKARIVPLAAELKDGLSIRPFLHAHSSGVASAPVTRTFCPAALRVQSKYDGRDP
jgi:hypothetical protein